jgi:hypothetical protein
LHTECINGSGLQPPGPYHFVFQIVRANVVPRPGTPYPTFTEITHTYLSVNEFKAGNRPGRSSSTTSRLIGR